ncbi:alpha-glucan family phosphorylase [Antricoccus suffuscus]|uniref:alpha-glucan family phosphorylase n=1 Tax=Antricoccus suffuscus TaxID=1629062 RepID=UPI000D07B561|nr:alpha-glucan family phosphorylase [Antricoccus suffuscus]
MKAIRRLTVRISLPPEISALNDVIMNLRWVWHEPARALFESIDPQLWRACGHNPIRLLGEVSADRLTALAADEHFKRMVDGSAADLRDYLDDRGWYGAANDKATDAGTPLPRQIAYFSPEFGITEVLPQYSGGLGILAGDHLKAASDLGVPIIGVGLLYGAGYFAQSLSADGGQRETYPHHDPDGMPLTKMIDAAGDPVLISIDLPEDQVLHAQVWRAQVGRVPLLLLDSDIEANSAALRTVTDRLYGGGKDHRIVQELLLGVGGVRAIRAYCAVTGTAAPEVYHTNEGHAGFQGLERIRELMTGRGLRFDEALQAVRTSTVFTTHTPVPAGIDRFEKSLLIDVLRDDRALPGVPIDQIVALGDEADPAVFNMAHMGFGLAARANGVSQLHGDVSRDMFNSLWPGFDRGEVPIGSVTNGVHAATWVAPQVFDLARRTAGDRPVGFDLIEQVPARELWELRNDLRDGLVSDVRRRVFASSLQRGMTAAELGWTSSVFDPNVLTIGFARRVPSYKRLTLMLRDPERLRALLLHPDHPVQIVLAGKSHPDDGGGKELIRQMVRFADDPEIRHRIVFLPDYDIEMARELYAGCDVWLNNPLRPLEACGTSGMKSALNGGLNLSIRDGWWDEMYDGRNGWEIPTADGVEDPDRRDDLEATALYDLLEREVAPLFYAAGDDAVPTGWVDMVRHTIASLGPKVIATRMLNDYVRALYAPSALAARAAERDDFAQAKALAAWCNKVRAAWPTVRVAFAESSSDDADHGLGSHLNVRAEVHLAGLSPDDVLVQVVYGKPDDDNELRVPAYAQMQPVGGDGDDHWYAADVVLDRQGAFGYTVRILPQNAALASSADLGLVSTA